METVIIVIHLMVVVTLVVSVLLQRSEGGALGIGGGGAGGGGFMSGRGTANVLTRVTAVLAVAFFATSMVLSLLAGQGGPASIFDNPASTPAPTAGEPASEEGTGGGGGVLDQLRQQGQGAPQVPQSE